MNPNQLIELRQRRYVKASAILTLNVSVFIAMILQFGLAKPSIAQQQKTAEVDKELRALLIARRDILRDLVETVKTREDISEVRDPSAIWQVIGLRQELWNAELKLAELREQRIAILTKSLEENAIYEDLLSLR